MFNGIIPFMNRLRMKFIVLTILGSVFLFSCQSKPVNPPATNTPLSETATPAVPTPTTVPMAVIVNGEGITIAEFQAELKRYQSALGTELATNQKEQVINDLIDQLLLAQAAQKEGFVPDETQVNERVKQVQDQIGGEQALQSWMKQLDYTNEGLRAALSRQIAAAWMRDWIYAQTPKTAEQVHARQILLYQADKATQVLGLLKSGSDFTKLAEQYDPLTYGDLGWFPRGFLLDKNLEDVIFSLSVGSYSDVVQTPAGFHIVQLIERDPNRALEADVYQAMQLLTLQNWLAKQRQDSKIEILTQ